jgi:hypothetical protein
MDGQPGQDDGEGAGPDPEPTPPPSGAPAPGPVPVPARSGPDPRLAQFAYDDAGDAPAPSGPMALAVDELLGRVLFRRAQASQA